MILKEHRYDIIAKEGTKPEDLRIPVVNNKPFKKITTSCGCTQVKVTSSEYTVSFDSLSMVKWMVGNEETQHYFIKSVNFTIVHEDGTEERVDINIAVHDSTI